MDNNYQNLKEEIEKINQKIQEYLWKKQYPFKATIFKLTNAECRFFGKIKNNSQRVIKEKKFYEDLTNSLNNNVEKLKDLDDLSQLAHEEENLQVQNEVLQNIKDLRSKS